MRDVEHPFITMALSTGYPTQEHSDFETYVENHPVEDVMGTEIMSGDRYFVIGVDETVVLEDNVEDFLIERLEAKAFTAK